MNIIKFGTVDTVLGRTGIKKGDIICIYFANGKEFLYSVHRNGRNGAYIVLKFEGGDDKQIVNVYEPSVKPSVNGAYQFMKFIAQITGLQAKFIAKTDNFIQFGMQKGKGLLLMEGDVKK